MLKKILFKKISLRCFIFIILTFGSYALSVLYLFGLHDILGSITFIFATFIFFHFLFIDIEKMNIRYFVLLLTCLCILEIPVFLICGRELNIRIVLSLLVFNGAIGMLFYSLKMIDFNSIGYFTRGGYIFTLCISIMYSVAFVGMFQSFPFTCQGLNDASGKLFEFVEKPFVMIKNRNAEKVDNKNKLDENVSNLIENINATDITTSEGETDNQLVKKINEFKENTINQILSDKSEYSEGVCDLILDEINTILANDGVKWSVILLSYFLLYGFIRIAIFVMSGLAFIIFKILYRCKVYKISETTKKVYEIY